MENSKKNQYKEDYCTEQIRQTCFQNDKHFSEPYT